MVSFSDWFLWDLRLKREGALGDLQEGQREAGGAGSLKGARKAIFQVGLFLKKKITWVCAICFLKEFETQYIKSWLFVYLIP